MDTTTKIIAYSCAGIFILCMIIIQRGRFLMARELEVKYKKALKSGSRELALKTGREYYSYLRKGKLSIYDEQAIANDLSTMSTATA